MKRNIARTSLTILSFALLLAGLVSAAHAQNGTTSCSLSTLKGNYSVQGQGMVVAQFPGFPAPPFPFAEVAIDFIDGAGNITGKFTLNADGVVVSGTVKGTYTMNPDCTGTFSLLTDLGFPVNETFLVLKNGGLRLVQTDPFVVVTRTMEKMRD
jgi:hypothetical protein